MKRKLPLSLHAVIAAAFLPALAFVGCKSTDVTESGTTADAVAGTQGEPAVEIVRPDKKEAGAATAMAEAIAKKAAEQEMAAEPDLAAVAEEPEKKKFRLFGFGKKQEAPEESPSPDASVAEAGTGVAEAPVDEEEIEAAEEPRRDRKPLFAGWGKGKKKNGDGEADDVAVAAEEEEEEDGAPAGTEVAEVREKKKFRLFGFGRKKDEGEGEGDEGEIPGDETADDEATVADKDDSEKEVAPVGQGPKPMPWDDPAPEVADMGDEEVIEPESFVSFPEAGTGAAAGVTARIRPGDGSGGFSPLDQPAPAASTAPDRVPSPTADPAPAPARPADDGFVPLSPEPKFPGDEEILPAGN